MSLIISNTVNFNESIAIKAFYIIDTSNYVANSISLSNVKGIYKITSPLGSVIYKNSGWDTNDFSGPDIVGNVSLNFNTQLLPLDANGEVLKGQYTIEYKSQVSGGTLPGIYTMIPIVYNYQFIAPVIITDQNFSCKDRTFTSSDITPYGSYISLVRTHTLYYPEGILPNPIAPVVSTFGMIEITDLYTQTYTTTISSIVSYQLSANVIGTYLLSNSREELVYCNYDPCKIYCCIKAVKDQMDAALGKSDLIYSQQQAVFIQLMSLKSYYDLTVSCGDIQAQKSTINEMVKISNCASCDSCGSQDDVPVLVSSIS